jgi:protein-L-isoaspartate(D-aspartate) O-methyltransferase
MPQLKQLVRSRIAHQSHQVMVDQLVERKIITDAAIEAAFRAVPRHLFLPNVDPDIVYRDQVIATKYEDEIALSSSSQPTIMALMLQQLGVAAGQHILEIGAGTGYNAALLAHLVGPHGHVVTLDIDADIVEKARKHLHAAGYDGVEVVQYDGALGYPRLAPYDRIILTVGAWDLLPACYEQLDVNGRLVVPLTLIPDVMYSIAFDIHEIELRSVSAIPCGFLPLRGALAHPPTEHWAAPHITITPRMSILLTNRIECTIEKEWSSTKITWRNTA